MTDREYFGGMPQPTQKERKWAIKLAKSLVKMVQEYDGDNQSEIETQIARELYCSVARMQSGN